MKKLDDTQMRARHDVIMQCIGALDDGVDRPCVVVDESGGYHYVPAAHLSDISYDGPRDCVFVVDLDSFGDGFVLEDRDDWGLAAAYAAECWQWPAAGPTVRRCHYCGMPATITDFFGVAACDQCSA